ncbi:hypothetical protein PIB30_082424 [Stylosanthes scabra]|uniref:Uncharacterized protein n=1 Tax=Stylosanthes scabra TaxID=79078 RepID=A0ABU6TSL6_9FABA|nr:hypothetical protein [Stylosanthes scabra]
MQVQQMQFFENMQKTQAQYLEELKGLKTKQNEMHTQQNNLYRQIRNEHGDLAKEIEEIKKFQVNPNSHGEANPNLVPIPACEIAKFVHDNAAKKRNIFHGALKNFEQGGPSNQAEPPPNLVDTPMEEANKES